MKKEQKLYKYLRTALKSDHGNLNWKISEWKKEKNIFICNKGFHASKTPLQALGYVGGEILAEVAVRGESIKESDKECWSEMKIVKTWQWKKEDSVELAIYAAELVIDIFEKKYPKDDRPRKAIEAAKNYLKAVKEGGDVNATNAAYAAANAAYAAANATYATYAATYAAYAAAYAAYAAAYAANATYAATYAANAATNAATYAANATNALCKKIDKWFIKKIKTLEVWTK